MDRLEELKRLAVFGNEHIPRELMQWAVAEIERLRAENERLSSELVPHKSISNAMLLEMAKNSQPPQEYFNDEEERPW